jgi:glucose/mannose-6-phosphate isomerase
LLLAITSGGKLGEMAERDGAPICKVPGGQPPRTAFGYLFLPLLLAAEKYGIVTLAEDDRQELLNLLEQVSEECGPANPVPENPAKQLAIILEGRIPIIYGAQGYTSAVALRWKTQFNENTKVPAFAYSFPEMNHNEIMGWEGVKPDNNTFAVILLRDGAESPRIKARFEITKSLIKDKAPVYEVWSRGESPLVRSMYLNLVGDWVSIYSALLRGVNPTAIQAIKSLKESLSKI